MARRRGEMRRAASRKAASSHQAAALHIVPPFESGSLRKNARDQRALRLTVEAISRNRCSKISPLGNPISGSSPGFGFLVRRHALILHPATSRLASWDHARLQNCKPTRARRHPCERRTCSLLDRSLACERRGPFSTLSVSVIISVPQWLNSSADFEFSLLVCARQIPRAFRRRDRPRMIGIGVK